MLIPCLHASLSPVWVLYGKSFSGNNDENYDYDYEHVYDGDGDERDDGDGDADRCIEKK